MKILLIFLGCAFSSSGFCNEADLKKNQEAVSKYIGYLMWESLKEYGFPYDLDTVIKSMQEAEKGNPISLNTADYHNLLREHEKLSFEKASSDNLLAAKTFLESIKNESCELEKSKLYYKIIEAGSGKALNGDESALFHIYCRTLEGKTLVDTYEQKAPAEQNLKDAIEGFRKGVSGMKEGEKRLLYIHPDLGYGVFQTDFPNSLLIVDVELVKIHAPNANGPH